MNNSQMKNPKGFVKAELYGILSERESYLGLCFLTEDSKRFRFQIKKQDAEKILGSINKVDNPNLTNHQEDRTDLTQFR